MKKKGSRNNALGCVVAVALVVILISGLCIISGIASAEKFERVRDRGVTVEAVITKVIEEYDAEDGTEYEVYIRYEYGGNTYDKLYGTYGSSAWKNRIGETLSLEVNPEDPSEEMDDVKSGVVIFYVGAALLGFFIYLFVVVWQSDKPIPDGTQVEKVCFVLRRRVWYKRISYVTLIASGAVWFLFIHAYPYSPNALAKILAGVQLIAGAVLIFLAARDSRAIRNETYRIKYDPLVRKYIRKGDDETPDSYILEYSGEKGTWDMAVTQMSYRNAQCGQRMGAVYLPYKKKPVYHFDPAGKWS